MQASPILIIDDDVGLSFSLSEMIRELGPSAIRAANGREALDLLREVTPSLMLVDLFMPLMGGIEFLRSIERDPRLRPIPRVIMTAANDQMVGVTEDLNVLYKPFDFGVLPQLLEQYCGVEASRCATALPASLGGPILAHGGTVMAHGSSRPSDRNWKSGDAASKIDESWKTRPSVETTGDEGHNAKLAGEHQRDENTPPRRSPGSRKGRTSK